MGTKMALHSTGFLHALTHRQLLLSLSVSAGCALAASVIAAAEATRSLAAGAAAWWLTLAGVVTGSLAVSLTYARRAGDLEDETMGCVDVGTLPRLAGADADPPRGD